MMWQISIFGSGGVNPENLTPGAFTGLILKMVSMSMVVLSAVCVIYIVMAGIQYVMAGGNAAEQANAKKTITYALLGLSIATLSFVIIGEVLQRLQFNVNV